MSELVLQSISAENYSSFADKTTFTTLSDLGKKEYLENVFFCGDNAYNKVSFIYGTNGSGKTYFCRILREIQRLLSLSPLIAMNTSQYLPAAIKDLDVPVPAFAFDTSFSAKPTRFSVDVLIEDILYHYEFAILNKKIVSELLTKKNKRTEKLIIRTSPLFKDIVVRSDFKGFDVSKHVITEEALCLPMMAFLNNPLAKKIVNAILDIQVINMAAAKIAPHNVKKAFSSERITKYIEILRTADPTLRSMDVSFEEEEIERQKMDSDDFENREFITTKTSVAVEATHAVYSEGVELDAKTIPFFSDESFGTVKLFTALPALFDVLEQGGSLIIDEIENGLHLSLVREIISLFISEKTNPLHAQLICTSHQPLLVDGSIRRDQVWVISKDDYGKSKLHRMSTFKTSRAKTNLANRIMENAFGCNPKSFFEHVT